MSKKLNTTVRAYLSDGNIFKRYIRIVEAVKFYEIDSESIKIFASAASAVYQLPRTTLINHMKMEEYMKHLYKVPNTSKYVQKKYVRIGEGSMIYSIGHHRFIEMARAAGAVYKINEGTGGTVLISLDIFDDYMEQFRENPIEKLPTSTFYNYLLNLC